MPRDFAISTEAFEEILIWLNPAREIAANIYVQLRRDLEYLFVVRGCSNPQGLADEVFDRVAKRINDVRPTFKGDPRYYFQAVAKNVAMEDLKERKRLVSLEDIEFLKQETDEIDEGVEEREECLDECLQKLSTENRQLILSYYAKEKQAKIDYRNELAQQLGISVKALRVRLHRMRADIGECINNCLARQASAKMKRLD